MNPLDDLLPIDRVQLLHEVEMQAFHDGQADWTQVDAADVPPGPARRQIEQWAEQREAQVGAAGAAEADLALRRVRDAEAAERAAALAVADAAREVGAAEQQRTRLRRILRGELRADDGGDWADTTRLSEDPRRGRIVDVLVYGAAAVADAGLNFLAFRIMGASTVETAVLAAAVVLVTVVLPKQLGEVVTTARRTGRWKGWPLALMTGGAALWVATALFAAVLRTAYLLLPTAVGRPTLLVVAGVGSTALTLGWLGVAVAIGAVVFLRSARRYNPSATAWHENSAQLTALRTSLAARRGAETAAAGRTASERDQLDAVGRRVEPLIDECRAVAAELVARYELQIARQRAAAEHRRGDARPALAGRPHRTAPVTPGCAPARTAEGAP
ncbi:hypothetical protein ACVGOW_03780 [Pseudonocardia saturnea]